MRWNCLLKALLFLQITAEHQDCPFFTVSLTIKTSFENISKTLKYISLKLHENRGGYWRKKLPLTILEEQFPVPTGWGSLLWPLRCHCNPDHNKFSSLSNTTMVAIFPNLCSCYGDVIYAQTWEVLILKSCIEPPKISLFQLRFTDLKKNRFPFLKTLSRDTSRPYNLVISEIFRKFKSERPWAWQPQKHNNYYQLILR